tara:strand:- start:127 stop:990 length:864 start_codon:yes stop_codon:yes gene_type:complete
MIIWLASYPKSGNTWLRFFIITLLMGNKTKINLNHLKAIIDFPNLAQFKDLVSNFFDISEVSKKWIAAQEKINSDNNLRFLKTHNMLGKLNGYSFTNLKNTLGTIHIVRDPRNIITSLKNHYSFPSYSEAKRFLFYERNIISLSNQEKEEFLKYNKKFPLPQYIGSWKTHYLSWRNMKKNCLLVKYENLIEDPINEFNKIVNFIEDLTNLKFDTQLIRDAVELSSFHKLKEMEQKYGFDESPKNKEGKKNEFFYLGPQNDWKRILENSVSDKISSEFKEEMKQLGYL